MQKYRADYSEPMPDGATAWFAKWFGGPSLAKIDACRIHGTELRRVVYVTGEPDTYFSIPACTRVKGQYIAGYLTVCDDIEGALIFHAMDRHKDRLKA